MTVDLIQYAHGLIKGDQGLSGVWPRATVFLARQALEEGLDRLWANTFPGVEQASRSTQLICMGQLLNDEVLVADVRSAWASLSRACHHHHYELAPTADELNRWLVQLKRLVETLGSASSGPLSRL